MKSHRQLLRLVTARSGLALLVLGCGLGCQAPAPLPGPEEHEPAGPGIAVEGVRVQLVPGGGAAAYFSIRNDGPDADRLLSVGVEGFATAELHETVDDGGVMRMRHRRQGFPIPSGATLVLEPGGAHVMLMRPERPHEPGPIALRLELERAGTIEVEGTAVAVAGSAPAPRHDG